jgi:hypothetical protein
MNSAQTPQVHLIGEIKGAYGFESSRTFCKFQVKCGLNWTLINGQDAGETYEEVQDEVD